MLYKEQYNVASYFRTIKIRPEKKKKKNNKQTKKQNKQTNKQTNEIHVLLADNTFFLLLLLTSQVISS